MNWMNIMTIKNIKRRWINVRNVIGVILLGCIDMPQMILGLTGQKINDGDAKHTVDNIEMIVSGTISQTMGRSITCQK